MIPSIDDRLDSVMRALQHVILPALPADQPLAIEQASLVLAQIGLIREQLDQAPAFERDEAAAMVALGEALAGVAAGGDHTRAAAAALHGALGAAHLDSPAAARRATQEVGAAVEELMDASLHDGSEAFKAASLEQVLAAGRHAAKVNRSWNRQAGFEAAEVP